MRSPTFDDRGARVAPPRFRVPRPSMPVLLCVAVLTVGWAGCWFLPDAIVQIAAASLCSRTHGLVLMLPH